MRGIPGGDMLLRGIPGGEGYTWGDIQPAGTWGDMLVRGTPGGTC